MIEHKKYFYITPLIKWTQMINDKYCYFTRTCGINLTTQELEDSSWNNEGRKQNYSRASCVKQN
ncbi:hypothetical protein BpHYR1_018235 [Brachionus plicatilis]|uniref:Uncharacterized protein n=1 Tax=Brachionus plicatilis TaxID=10195 RepID=A0A3M7QXF4_BRAPC|nr:hypothetical protein BpHYR1_018235 [Brachionus plicatilis]